MDTDTGVPEVSLPDLESASGQDLRDYIAALPNAAD